MKRPLFYRYTFRSLQVTLHLSTDHLFHWTRIYGVQWGSWFIGAIQGSAAPLPDIEQKDEAAS